MTDTEREVLPMSSPAETQSPGGRPGVSEYLLAMTQELKAPLNAIIGMSGLLLDDDLSAKQRQYAKGVNAAVESLSTILNDVLDLARISAGRLVIEPIPFDLKSMIEETASVLTPRANERGLALRVDLRPELPRYVIGDPGRTRQVLGNLVGHAVNATSQGEVVIRVTPDGERGGMPAIRFTVEDTGIGISPDRLSRVFDEYVPVDASPYRSFGVTGLGLRLSAELVRLLGGQIGVESDPGRGSRFWLSLPMTVTEPSDVSLPGRHGARAGGRILIVEADPSSRSRLTKQFEAAGWEADVLDDLDGLVDQLREAEVVGNPYQVCAFSHYAVRPLHVDIATKLKADPRLAPVALVMITAVGSPGEGKRLWHAGYAAYLRKPVPSDEIQEMLEALTHVGPNGRGGALITRHSLAEVRNAQSFEVDGIDAMLASLTAPEAAAGPEPAPIPVAELAVVEPAPVDPAPVAELAVVEPAAVDPAPVAEPAVELIEAATAPPPEIVDVATEAAATTSTEQTIEPSTEPSTEAAIEPAIESSIDLSTEPIARVEPVIDSIPSTNAIVTPVAGLSGMDWETSPPVDRIEGLMTRDDDPGFADGVVEPIEVAPPGAPIGVSQLPPVEALVETAEAVASPDETEPTESIPAAIDVVSIFDGDQIALPGTAPLPETASVVIENDEPDLDRPFELVESDDQIALLPPAPSSSELYGFEPVSNGVAPSPGADAGAADAAAEDAADLDAEVAQLAEPIELLLAIESVEDSPSDAGPSQDEPVEVAAVAAPVAPAAELDLSREAIAGAQILEQLAQGAGFFTQHLVASFLREAPARIGALATATTRGDWTRIGEAVAGIRRASASIGADRLAALADRVATLVEADRGEDAGRLLGGIEHAFLEVRQALESAGPHGLPADLPPIGPGFIDQLSPERDGPARMLANKLTDSFITEAPTRMVDLRNAVASGDAESAQRLAQTLKGMCGLIGAESLAKLSALVEADARLKRVALADRYLDHIDLELTRVQAALGQARG